MKNKIKLGILGGGGDSLIGIVHRIASSMHDKYKIIGGCFNPNPKENKDFAETLGLDLSRVYDSIEAMMEGEKKLPEGERIEAVSVLTPNFLHYPMAKQLLDNGFHVICEKPLTTTYAEAEDLVALQAKMGTVFAVTYTYTGYPMIRQMKHLIETGTIGKVQKVDLQYYQGWINPIIHDTKARQNTWRLQPDKSGLSCCIGDIGTHAFDMLEYVTSLKVTEILADLNFLYEDNPMDIDGTILVHLNNESKGVIRASQIATGEENNFTVAIYGEKGGLKWEQENPNYLHHLTDHQPFQTFKRGNAYNSAIAQDGAKVPSGHPEGFFDAMGNIYKGVAKAIRGETAFEGEYPSLEDGARGMKFIEQVVASHKKGNQWMQL